MKQALWILLACAACAPQAADAQGADVLVEQLRQDVRELQRLAREQSRQIERLEREIARLKARPAQRAVRPGETAPPDVDARWLSAAPWTKVRTGMSELEVIETLGPPTAVRRESENSKTLIYTLELEGTGFLSGSVQLEDDRVVQASAPTLR